MRNPPLITIPALLIALVFTAPGLAAEGAAGGEGGQAGGKAEGKGESTTLDWESWRAGNEPRNIASLQKGARDFVNYCFGCHSLKYLRYSRMAADLHISEAQLAANLMPMGDKPTDYMISSAPVADLAAWFGKEPPDLSLIARSRSPDYIYRFLKTFYVDRATNTQANNLQLANTAMPAVLSDLEGTKEAVFREVMSPGEDGKPLATKVFDHFEQLSAGKLSPADYDAFVRDTVNFLDYASDPTQVKRHDIGIWVVLFLLVFTWFAWLLKKEYWKDVH